MRQLFILSIALLLASCKSTNFYELSQQVARHNLNLQYVTANQFELMYLSNRRAGRTLHVYLEGDGLPWASRYQMSNDPSPKNPLALSLMTQDLSNAIYLSRPCYYLVKPDTKCDTKLWTSARYSQTVVDTMLAAIRKIIDLQLSNSKTQINQVVLIGYSGGGVLASLLAEELKLANFYVTIASNLDTKAWTDYHQYSPLTESINPMSIERNSYKPALHFVGSADKVVPGFISQDFIDKSSGTLITLKSFDHTCCWVKKWPQQLEKIKIFQQKTNLK